MVEPSQATRVAQRTQVRGKRRIASGLAYCAALLAAGCEATFSSTQPASKADLAPGFQDAPPAEVAILPIQQPLGGESEGAGELVDELYQELIRKAYTPLDPEFVARRLPKRDFAGGPPDIAVLKAAIEVDAFLLVELLTAEVEGRDRDPRYRLYARAWLLDGDSGTTLYRHELLQTYPINIEGSGTLSDGARREKLRLFAGRLLTLLPLRREAR